MNRIKSYLLGIGPRASIDPDSGSFVDFSEKSKVSTFRRIVRVEKEKKKKKKKTRNKIIVGANTLAMTPEL